MSIELKQAAEKALVVLGSATSFMSRKARDQHESVVAAPRAAIQQPATTDPIKLHKECATMPNDERCDECQQPATRLPEDVVIGHVTLCKGSNISLLIDHAKRLNADVERLEAQQPATTAPVEWLDAMLADARETFDADGGETPQVVRDVIEYVASWATVYREKNHPAPSVPEFSRIAKRKLADLQEQGFTITGYAIQRGTQRGFITNGGFVGWWRGDEAPSGVAFADKRVGDAA